jgi:hypothetical protein
MRTETIKGIRTKSEIKRMRTEIKNKTDENVIKRLHCKIKKKLL